MISVVTLTVALATAAEPIARVVGENRRTTQRLAEADDLARRSKFAEALDLYVRVLDEAGDDFVPASEDGRIFSPARAVIFRRIFATPELLQPYRRRVEPRASQLLEAALRSDAPAALERWLDDFRVSRSADIAYDRLGELAFERGEFLEAERHWSRTSQRDTAPVAAKILLARIARAEDDSLADAVAAFRDRFPDATGRLAGRDGRFADLLAERLRERPPPRRVPKFSATLGVANDRAGLLEIRWSPSPRFAAPPAWLTEELPPIGAFQRPAVTAARLSVVPQIVADRVWVNDGSRVLAFDPATGDGHTYFDLAAAGMPPRETPDPAGVRYTLTAHAGRIFAHVGRGGYLVCLQRAGDNWPLRWVLPAPEGQRFDGSPVVRDGRLFASLTRIEGNRAITAVAAFDELLPTTGPIWVRDVAERPLEGESVPKGELLTLAGSRVFAAPHAGVIVALDATSGRRLWAYSYPRRPTRLTRDWIPPERDLVPAVVVGGRLFAAPVDADRVLCLDPMTGEPLWDRGPAFEAVHLLGVVAGRLILTSDGFHRGIAALDVRDGRLVPDWGALHGDRPFGRGALLEDVVIWPTRSGLKLLRHDGRPIAAPHLFSRIPGGHLAVGDGWLAAATTDRLYILRAEPAAGSK